jgi:hypothetical protein
MTLYQGNLKNWQITVSSWAPIQKTTSAVKIRFADRVFIQAGAFSGWIDKILKESAEAIPGDPQGFKDKKKSGSSGHSPFVVVFYFDTGQSENPRSGVQKRREKALCPDVKSRSAVGYPLILTTASIARIWPKTLFMHNGRQKQECQWDAGMDIMYMCQSALLLQGASRSTPKEISGIL